MSQDPVIAVFDQTSDRRAATKAVEYAELGGIALHLWRPTISWKARAPIVFRRYDLWAHLFDRDLDRLVTLAKRCGVRVIAVGRRANRGQHIDLCGGPLRKILEIARKS